jgi:hypothetical protein
VPIQKISVGDKKILHVDYRNMNEQMMIAQVEAVKRILLEGNVPMLILSEYNKKNYGYPRFMKKLQEATREVLPLIKKSAIVGDLNAPQRLMLKAYNFFFKRNIKAFISREAAIEYLLDERTTDYDTPDYLKP